MRLQGNLTLITLGSERVIQISHADSSCVKQCPCSFFFYPQWQVEKSRYTCMNVPPPPSPQSNGFGSLKNKHTVLNGKLLLSVFLFTDLNIVWEGGRGGGYIHPRVSRRFYLPFIPEALQLLSLQFRVHVARAYASDGVWLQS